MAGIIKSLYDSAKPKMTLGQLRTFEGTLPEGTRKKEVQQIESLIRLDESGQMDAVKNALPEGPLKQEIRATQTVLESTFDVSKVEGNSANHSAKPMGSLSLEVLNERTHSWKADANPPNVPPDNLLKQMEPPANPPDVPPYKPVKEMTPQDRKVADAMRRRTATKLQQHLCP